MPSKLTIAFDSNFLLELPGLMGWLKVIGAEIEEGRITLVGFPHTTQIRTLEPRTFTVFEPGVNGELTIHLELDIYDTAISFEGTKV